MCCQSLVACSSSGSSSSKHRLGLQAQVAVLVVGLRQVLGLKGAVQGRVFWVMTMMMGWFAGAAPLAKPVAAAASATASAYQA
jgi:hypothetical protein